VSRSAVLISGRHAISTEDESGLKGFRQRLTAHNLSAKAAVSGAPGRRYWYADIAPSPHSSDNVTNVLFVCSANRLRSPTAEQIFSTWPGIETDSAGISNGANVLLSSEQVEWADIIFVMEKTHRDKLNRKFRSSLKGKRVICLDIPDDYEFMDPVLVRMLESRAGRFLPTKL
jgi:predicted protein tyrosine phosphatase